MRLILQIVLMIVLFTGPLLACDVNLLSLVSGKRPSNVFTSKIGLLVEDVQNVGQNIFEKDKVTGLLKKLMLSWVEFDTQYSQFPPEWAKKDSNWKSKIKTIANQIGTVKKLLKESKDVEAHTNVLSISRKITGLLEYMPMSPKEKILLSFPAQFDLISDALVLKNNENLGVLLAQLMTEKEQLRTLVGSSTIPLTDEFSSWIDNTVKIFKDVPEKMHFKLKISLGFAQDSFVKMNAKLKELDVKN